MELLVGKATGVFVGFQVVPPGITASHGRGGPGPPAKPELSPDGKSIWSPIKKTSPTWSSDLKQHGTPASASYEPQRSLTTA